jgi:hypothetical protein
MNDDEVELSKGAFGLFFFPVADDEFLVVWITSAVDKTGLQRVWTARSNRKVAEFYPTIWSACLVCMMSVEEGFTLNKQEVRKWMTWLIKT